MPFSREKKQDQPYNQATLLFYTVIGQNNALIGQIDANKFFLNCNLLMIFLVARITATLVCSSFKWLMVRV